MIAESLVPYVGLWAGLTVAVCVLGHFMRRP